MGGSCDHARRGQLEDLELEDLLDRKSHSRILGANLLPQTCRLWWFRDTLGTLAR
jgi:hypothetical protein